MGNIDSYKYFVDKGIEILGDNGVLSYIMPDSYLEKEYFKDLRDLVISKSSLIRSIKLGDDIFENVKLPTAIIFLVKGDSEQKTLEFLDVSEVIDIVDKLREIYKNDYTVTRTGHFDAFSIKKSLIRTDNCIKLIDVYDQVMGVKVYQIGKGKPKQTKYEIEHDVFISHKKQTDNDYLFIAKGIERYYYKPSNEFINYGEWLAEPRELKYFVNPKIIVREVVNPRIFATYISYPTVVKNIAAVIIEKSSNFDLKYLLGLINSRLFTYLIVNESPKSSNKAYSSFNSRMIKNLPIKNISLEQQKFFVEKVDRLLNSNEEFNELVSGFLNFIESNYTPKKLSTKLQKCYTLSFSKVLQELKKQNVSLTSEDEATLRDTFDHIRATSGGDHQHRPRD